VLEFTAFSVETLSLFSDSFHCCLIFIFPLSTAIATITNIYMQQILAWRGIVSSSIYEALSQK